MVRLTKNGILMLNFYNDINMTSSCICNFKCSYCNIRNCGTEIKPITRQQFIQTKILWNLLAGINDRIHVRINFNGEIFVDKWAKECVFYINQIPNVDVCEIVTNNSINPKLYLNKLDLTKTSFSCSFHPEFISLQKFLKNILIIKNSGCKVHASIVCAPHIINKIPKIYHIFKNNNIILRLQAFRTQSFRYLGKKYPRDYTPQERKILKEYFYSNEEYNHKVDLKSSKGLNCFAGVDIITLSIDGSIRRCLTGKIGKNSQEKQKLFKYLPEKLNNIVDNTLKNTFLNKFTVKFFHKETKIEDLIAGKVKLEKEPYPCHENICECLPNLSALEDFRKKYRLSKNFVDLYELA
ncbi:MAG: hypothetical protein ACFFAH_01640 [Promethearchaeota archaeon]